ncbi:hypothetical protein M9H77_31650 [Catharanthus roseus]|uniref:Uncharacterized protein n=1 Tax=Catharanthus roseus TaxID=4058 RepID=A0ACC0A0R9_CATRO|nr:hypothetical protein M9H77_31650 [Catharanthus roseus]
MLSTSTLRQSLNDLRARLNRSLVAGNDTLYLKQRDFCSLILAYQRPLPMLYKLEHVRGEDHHSHIFHSIAWDTLCRSKEFGGLSIPNLQKLNLAYLAKLDWCFSQHQHALWGQVFHGKYGNVQDACV